MSDKTKEKKKEVNYYGKCDFSEWEGMKGKPEIYWMFNR